MNLERAVQAARRELSGPGPDRRVRFVEVDGRPLVVKVFGATPRDEAAREWRGLTLLEWAGRRYAPAPVWCELDHELPAMAMTRVAGKPLGGEPLDAARLSALGELLADLFTRVPAPELPAIYAPAAGLTRLRQEQWPVGPLPGWPDLVRAAHATGTRWLTSRDADRLLEPSNNVFGRGDSNLANFIWDGAHLSHVDFEDSGHRDVATELADLVEHLASRCTPDPTWSAFVSGFGLRGEERARHLAARRLLALFWLVLLLPGGPAFVRNPEGTLEQQAERVLTLLA